MSGAHAGAGVGDAMRGQERGLARSAAEWLHLAATPTFAFMALLTGVSGGGAADALCSVAGVSAIGGMTPMYILMSAFHSVPWLRFIAGLRSAAGRF